VSKARPPLPPRVTQALAKLGADLKNARRRRRMPMAHAADRALISRSTLHKVERGDPGVSLGVYATVLFGYGMIERLERLVDMRWDWTPLVEEEDRLPRRIRR
jgi:transcriptional regulator with XRE-family HTH domain